ncbi:hypothetical protein PVAND_007233 [Polypedilum vanderplanki]|uniref:F-box domain-containing protein n=1 Tax=Polypedilum vanderplanki TaxID=319348 RepID=A0A9J6C6M5_POLVA|nr:hypothetical protein PVAND_007233 [Polypedilum vanderplanki]
MNFLEHLPFEIVEIIFQHLNGRDVLNLSEVNNSFNNFIAKCLNKIVFNVKKKASLESIQNVLKTSTRHYRHVKISQYSNFISSKLITWPIISLTISDIDFSNFDDFLTLMMHSKFVQEMRMSRIFILSVEKTHKEYQISFEYLKILNFHCCHSIIYEKILRNCSNLKKFSIKAGSEMPISAENTIKNLLIKNSNLKFLEIHFNIFGIIFGSDFLTNSLKFKLKRFEASSNLNQSFEMLRSNFCNFLLTQIDTLEEISIHNWMGLDVMKIIFLSPHLQKLTLKGFHNYECENIDWENLELQRNNSIEVLNFHDISENFQIFRTVVNACSYLKKCSFYSLNNEMINYLASNCSKLISIHVEKLFVNSSDYELKNLIIVS